VEEAVAVIEVAVNERGKGCHSIWVLACIKSGAWLRRTGLMAAPAMVLISDMVDECLHMIAEAFLVPSKQLDTLEKEVCKVRKLHAHN
jgi:hypothetical protein